MLLNILCILFLKAPYLWELYNDRNGDNHMKNMDWILRVTFVLLFSALVAIIHPDKNFWQALALSFGMFTFIFTYLVNVVHYYRGVTSNPKWWSHLSKDAIPDRWFWWQGTPWWARMGILFGIFLATAKIYYCWGKLFSFYSEC